MRLALLLRAARPFCAPPAAPGFGAPPDPEERALDCHRCARSQAWCRRHHLRRELAPSQRRPRATNITIPTEPRNLQVNPRACPACRRDVCHEACRTSGLTRQTVSDRALCLARQAKPSAAATPATHGRRLGFLRRVLRGRALCHRACRGRRHRGHHRRVHRLCGPVLVVLVLLAVVVSFTVGVARALPPLATSAEEWRRHCTVCRVRPPAGGGPLCGPLPPGPLLH